MAVIKFVIQPMGIESISFLKIILFISIIDYHKRLLDHLLFLLLPVSFKIRLQFNRGRQVGQCHRYSCSLSNF